MPEWQDMLAGRRLAELDARFEERVFGKIARRKRQRHVALGLTAAAGVAVLAAVLIPILGPRPDANLLGRSGEVVKEEIPVNDRLTFAAQDGRTVYTIDRISFNRSGGGKMREEGTEGNSI